MKQITDNWLKSMEDEIVMLRAENGALQEEMRSAKQTIRDYELGIRELEAERNTWVNKAKMAEAFIEHLKRVDASNGGYENSAANMYGFRMNKALGVWCCDIPTGLPRVGAVEIDSGGLASAT